MGLDTSHGCWSGPYSAFMYWRVHLHFLITGAPATRESLCKYWDDGFYDDQSIPINVLMDHSDCDGEILHKDCKPLAESLLGLAERIHPDWKPWEDIKYKIYRFAEGLLLAHKNKENVEFH